MFEDGWETCREAFREVCLCRKLVRELIVCEVCLSKKLVRRTKLVSLEVYGKLDEKLGWSLFCWVCWVQIGGYMSSDPRSGARWAEIHFGSSELLHRAWIWASLRDLRALMLRRWVNFGLGAWWGEIRISLIGSARLVELKSNLLEWAWGNTRFGRR